MKFLELFIIVGFLALFVRAGMLHTKFMVVMLITALVIYGFVVVWIIYDDYKKRRPIQSLKTLQQLRPQNRKPIYVKSPTNLQAYKFIHIFKKRYALCTHRGSGIYFYKVYYDLFDLENARWHTVTRWQYIKNIFRKRVYVEKIQKANDQKVL